MFFESKDQHICIIVVQTRPNRKRKVRKNNYFFIELLHKRD